MMYVTYPDYETEYIIGCDAHPYEDGGEVFVPLEPVCEKLKASAIWNNEKCDVTIVKEDIEFEISSADLVFKNNQTFTTVKIINDFFGCESKWESAQSKLVFVTGVDYYRKWHQQENSQFWLEFTTDDLYPSYLSEEAEVTIESIKEIHSPDITSMAFLTDAHYTPCSNDSLALTRAVNTYKDIASKIKIDGMVLGGDHMYEGSKEKRLDALKDYRSHFEGINYYPINGNHDNGYIWDSVYVESPGWPNHFDRPEIYNALYNHLPKNGAIFNTNDPKSLYYYVDNNKDKVRYIMLDGHSFVDDDGNNLNPTYDAIGQKQTDWLANTALKFNEEGWTVLVFIHKMQLPETSSTAHIRVQYPIRLILDSFKTGASLKGTYPEGKKIIGEPSICDYDFSHYVKADIAGVIAGDFHHDDLEYSQAKIPYVYTAAFVAQDVDDNPLRPERRNGTKSEILFDIISIDRKGKRLYVSRVGAGLDRGGIKY